MATDEVDGLSTERPEDDDYDLLTYGEASARLAIEVRKERERLAQLDDSSPDAEATRRRIADLEQAAIRQRDAQRDARDFIKTFGFDPKVR